MEPELIVGAGCPAGRRLGWSARGPRARSWRRAGGRLWWPRCCHPRPGMPLLPVLIVFIVRWHGRPVRRCRDVRRGLSALFAAPGHVLVRRHVSGFAPGPKESRAQNWRAGPADTASGPAAWGWRWAGLPVSEPAGASGYWSVGEPTW